MEDNITTPAALIIGLIIALAVIVIVVAQKRRDERARYVPLSEAKYFDTHTMQVVYMHNPNH